MALQIWLPLNEDLRNQGVKNVTVTNNGATLTSGGKFGKCYNFNGSNNYLKTNPIFSNGNQNLTFSCWVKFTTLPASDAYYCLLCSRTSTGNSGVSIFMRGNKAFYIDIGARWTTATQGVITTGQWFNIVLVSSTTGRILYINGNQVASTTSVKTAPSAVNPNCISIGAQHSSTAGTIDGTYLNGCLNDVRIYNHALDPKEVKEISKGLVLHYQLKDLGSTQQHKNLLPDTNVNSLTKVIGAANRYYEQKSQSGYTATWESISDPPVPGILWGVRYVITAVNGFHGVTWYDGNTISVGAEPYTLSCYAKRVSGTNVQLKFEYGKSPYVTETFTMANDNEWHQYSWTFTPATASGQAAASGTTRIYGPGPASISEIIVCGWKLEKGTVATPWTETGNIIVDCSGFNHHGVTIGAPSNPANSVRFDKAVKFSATTQHIMVPDFPTSGFGDSYTFAWWGTRSANNTMFWSFANGIKLNGMYNGNLWNTFDSSDNPLYAPGTTTQVTASAVSTWNHWVMTGDGTSCKVYKDGELFGVAKTYKSISGSTFFINGYCALTNYASNNLTISDFRIYSTALSADDIEELFKTSMTTSGTAREVI